MKKFVSISIFIGVLLVSSFAMTATAAGTVTVDSVCANTEMGNVSGIISWASCLLIKLVVPFLFSLATVAFIWGVFQYYLNPENEEKRKKGKSFIIGGLIALFVMLSMWGIVKILTGTFNIQNTIPQLPQ